MLTQEDAQSYLKTEQTSDWLQVCLAAIRSDLPAELQPAAYVLLNCDENGKTIVNTASRAEQEQHQQAITRGFRSLTTLDPEQRIAIFSSLVPRFAPTIEAAWQLLGSRPYQVSHQRRSFRAPGDDGAAFRSRTFWLKRVMQHLPSYRDKEIHWFATWAAYLVHHSADLGLLFAAAIDAGGPEGEAVFDALVATAHGKHPTSKIDRNVIGALLAASRPDGWACIEQLLLAAQREEGLRQVILESVDEAHPQAFRRMLHLILGHDLLRFAAVVRASDVWLGFGWDVEDVPAIRNGLATILTLLDDAEQRQSFLSQGNPQQVYFALWASAFEDASATITIALPLLSDPLAERRLAATYLLSLLSLPTSRYALVPMLTDPDLRVALLAVRGIQSSDLDAQIPTYGFTEPNTPTPPISADLFERLESLLQRLNTSPKTIESGIWPWLTIDANSVAILSMMITSLGERSPLRLIPYLALTDQWGRVRIAKLLAALPVWDETVHNTLYGLIGDRTSWVSEQALNLVAQRKLTPEAIPMLETLLTRKNSNLRRGILNLFSAEADESVLASADRLLASSHTRQRLAGLDLLYQLSSAGRAVAACQERAHTYQQQETLTSEETPLVTTILAIGKSQAPLRRTRENVLGLISPADCSPRIAPCEHAFELKTPAAFACLSALDALIEEYRSTPLVIKNWQGSLEVLLGNTGWQFTSMVRLSLEAEDPSAHLPLAQVWQEWERGRTSDLRDSDDLELLRALLLAHKQASSARPQAQASESEEPAPADRPPRLRYPQITASLLEWLLRLQGISTAMLDFLLDIAETRLARISRESLERELAGEALQYHYHNGIRESLMNNEGSFRLLLSYIKRYPTISTPIHHQRHWQLLHWYDQPLPEMQRRRPPLEVVLAAYSVGAATEADILDQLGGPHVEGYSQYSNRCGNLSQLSTRKPDPLIEKYPILQHLLPVLRTRILEIELERGELPTVATPLALSLHTSGDATLFVRVLSLLSPDDFTRGYVRYDESKATVFSHLLRISYPGPEDTPARFTRQINAAKLDFKRLVAAAIYAPQWARLIEHALDWPHFEEAVWWISAHTKDSQWSVNQEIRAIWQAQTAERTPLTAQDLLAGAVDVAWFWRCYTTLGPERWEQLYAAAKYASGSSGHGRARLFADAMIGKIVEGELLQRINVKRTQDAVRALGLLPLPNDDTYQATIHARYVALQEFLRSGRQFGVQRRTSEQAAVTIGLENLARTAGYPDPIRLQWAMEAQEGLDLRNGPLTITVGDIHVTLTLDEITAAPSLSITRGKDKPLKSLPTALKKQSEIVALLDLKKEIEHQISRMRPSLEAAMCRGDLFTATELLELLTHPVLSRLLRNLVFLRDGDILGYPQRREGCYGAELYFVSHDESVRQVEHTTTNLRLAHPVDLLKSAAWSAWQRECFAAERIQPFKQIFRELYVCTPNEMRNGQDALSWRYSGHQVQPKQALALLGQRGWIASYEDGEVNRTFHSEGLVARLSLLHGAFTPTEMEGQTLEYVSFSKCDDWRPIPLVEVPQRLFSEVMRDLDMVVSVAASSGVDPEASTSTVEMRASLIDETCMLLGFQNVTLKSAHALIEGQLGNYSVHLGSGIVHRQPGGALCIIPVHAQQRGRVFLPFADNDPKTAEVITKIITLARDQDIKDPTIMEQLLRTS